MFVRVVRFTDVDRDRIESMLQRVEENDGPPEGVPASGLKVMFDEDQGTAVVIQEFASRDDMETGARVLAAMDPSDTPGTRASVDSGELRVDISV